VTMMRHHIAKSLRAFRADQTGSMIVEFVVTAPLLLGLIVFGFEFFDAYKSSSRAAKASYAVADFTSIKRTHINTADVQEMDEMLDALLPWLSGEKSVRVTAIRRQAKDDKYVIDYSKISGTEYVPMLKGQELTSEYRAMVPDIAKDDQVILIETRVPHRPMIDFMKLSNIIWKNEVVVYPRNVL